jgi:hypothetical protein
MKNCDLSSTLCILQIELLYLQTIDYHACVQEEAGKCIHREVLLLRALQVSKKECLHVFS